MATTNEYIRLTSNNVAAAGLGLAACGISIQIIVGVPFPPIPPGLFITLIPAVFIVTSRYWWRSLVAVGVGLFLMIGFIVSGNLPVLADLSWFSRWIGCWIFIAGICIAIVTGTQAFVHSRKLRHG